MRRVTRFVCLSVLGACAGPDFESGDAAVCLGTNGETQISETATASWDVAGQVNDVREFNASDDATMSCGGTATTAVDVVDFSGATWTLGFGIRDAKGKDAQPELDLAIGDSVDLLFRQEVDGGIARGFVLYDGNGLVAAMDDGTDGGALAAGDVENLKVNRGAEVGSTKDDCGKMEGTVISFQADTRTNIAPFDTTTVELNGTRMDAFAIDSYYWSKVKCDDASDRLTWALFR
jgi:hypothetical protein